MLTTAAPGVDVERMLAEADALLRGAAPRPAPPVLPPESALMAAGVRELRELLAEARDWSTGRPPEKALVGRPRLSRALLRVLFWPMRVLAWPQRKFNRAALDALETMLEMFPAAAYSKGNGAPR